MHHQRHRTGSILLFTLGLLLVMVAMSYSFMSSMRLRRDANESMQLVSLAEMTARQGAAHAAEVLTRDYLSQPGLPTHLGLRYRTAFDAIDTRRVGKALRGDTVANAQGYNPMGSASSMEDDNGNDVKTELLLTVPYNGVYQTGGGYGNRAEVYAEGMLLHDGLARYIEPGYYHDDLPVYDYLKPYAQAKGKPVSFHLEHPAPADPVNPDPARRRGEPWTPNRNSPLYLDQDLVPVPDRASARYRFRYAVAIEDLSGHLPISWQEPYTAVDPTTAKSTTYTESTTAPYDELDEAIGAKYADPLFNIMAILWVGEEGTGFRGAWYGWLLGQGRGSSFYTPATDTVPDPSRFPTLSHFVGLDMHRYAQPDAYSRPDQSTLSSKLTSAFRGPMATWQNMQAFIDKSAFGKQSAMTYTLSPYGRRPNVVPAPGAHYADSQVNTPWQVNLPTAVPDAIQAMFDAYLPEEATTRGFHYYDKYTITSINADGDSVVGAPYATKLDPWSLSPPPVREKRAFLNLFAPASSHGACFAHLGVLPYPGTELASGTPHPDWRRDLGKDIDVNTTVLGMAAPATVAFVSPRPPFWGMGGGAQNTVRRSYGARQQLRAYAAQVIKDDNVVGGELWRAYFSYVEDEAGGASFTRRAGVYYEDSYYMDLAVAWFHAVSVAQAAWLPDNGGASDDYPLDGRVQYPAGLTNPAFMPLLADGKPLHPAPIGMRDADVMDTDADGDGVVDSPSAFDAVWKIDRLFVNNLGEHFGPALGSSAQGLYLVKNFPYAGPNSNQYKNRCNLVAWTANNTIASLLADGKITAGEARLMELVLNDMRLSFFGSSAQYPDFKAIDFDNDSQARCSGYKPSGSAPAGADRFGPVVPASDRFSLTGNFLFQKSHLFRAFIRGEVFDTVRELPVEWTLLETVFAIDPAGRIYDLFNKPIPRPGGSALDPNSDGQTNDAEIVDDQVLFQRYHWIRHQSHRPRAYP